MLKCAYSTCIFNSILPCICRAALRLGFSPSKEHKLLLAEGQARRPPLLIWFSKIAWGQLPILDTGNIVPITSPETHIPIEDFIEMAKEVLKAFGYLK